MRPRHAFLFVGTVFIFVGLFGVIGAAIMSTRPGTEAEVVKRALASLSLMAIGGVIVWLCSLLAKVNERTAITASGIAGGALCVFGVIEIAIGVVGSVMLVGNAEASRLIGYRAVHVLFGSVMLLMGVMAVRKWRRTRGSWESG